RVGVEGGGGAGRPARERTRAVATVLIADYFAVLRPASGRDLDRELLSGDANPLRARGHRLFQPPAQHAVVQLPDLPVDRGGDNDRELSRAVREAPEQARPRVDRQPRGPPME